MKNILNKIATLIMVLFGLYCFTVWFLTPVVGMLMTFAIMIEVVKWMGWEKEPAQIFIIIPPVMLNVFCSFQALTHLIGV